MFRVYKYIAPILVVLFLVNCTVYKKHYSNGYRFLPHSKVELYKETQAKEERFNLKTQHFENAAIISKTKKIKPKLNTNENYKAIKLNHFGKANIVKAFNIKSIQGLVKKISPNDTIVIKRKESNTLQSSTKEQSPSIFGYLGFTLITLSILLLFIAFSASLFYLFIAFTIFDIIGFVFCIIYLKRCKNKIYKENKLQKVFSIIGIVFSGIAGLFMLLLLAIGIAVLVSI